MGQDKITFFNIKDNDKLKKSIIDGLSGGISPDKLGEFTSLMNQVLDKSYLFDKKAFKGHMYRDDDEILSLILPAVRRIYGRVVLSPPNLFKEKRLQLFMLYFDIDEFLDYLVDMIPKCKSCLKHFENLDRAAETLTLIVDNYLAMLVKKVRECEDIDIELRDIKIKRVTND